ncbi:hypothetical protein [Nocardioides jensenii]|uniref:hypothetical protein n=1 Tax=Nocardioides jensenii TaxID=1843 RepID=UPI00082BE708|nr:hypothetical protein [Nocardioides jensenii]
MTDDGDQRSISSPVGDEAPPGMPSWVKYLLLGLLAVVLIVVLAMLVGGGDHGPGRHGASHSAPVRPDDTVALT